MKLLGLAGSALALQSPFPRVKNNAFCDISTVHGESCDDIFKSNPNALDGIYKIKIGSNAPTVVECKFNDGVGWTVIQKRSSGQLDFNRDWRNYKAGFSTFSERGCASQCVGEDNCGESEVSTFGPRPNCDLDEYWIGLENIHALTEHGARLKIDLQRYTQEYGTVHYDDFKVGSESSGYKLVSVGYFTNDRVIDVGDSFIGAGFGEQGFSPLDKQDTNHVGMQFTTKDRDNDGYESGNCGFQDKSGWWFNRCSAVNLNGVHYGTGSGSLNYKEDNARQQSFDDGILWQTWTNNKYESLVGTRMMVGPKPDKSSHTQLEGKDCQEIAEKLFKSGALKRNSNGAFDDIYKIMPDGTTVPKYTECKFQVCQNSPIGWSMIQKRYDGSVEFNQNWNAYRSGFGCVAERANAKPSWIGECWLGNEYIHALSGAVGGGALLIEMARKFDRSPNEAVVAYEEFSVGNERSRFQLSKINGYRAISGNAGDAFRGTDFGGEGFNEAEVDKSDTDHLGMRFSTNDRDNDLYEEGNCAEQDRSGWWFNRCSAANLNGHYYKSGLVDKNDNGFVEFDDGVLWQTWTHTKWESIIKTKMWVGPQGAVQKCYGPGTSSQVKETTKAPPRRTTRRPTTTKRTTTTKQTTVGWDYEYPEKGRTDDSSYDSRSEFSSYSDY